MSGDHNEGVHLFPFRTQKLSPLVPMVLFLSGDGRVGSCRAFFMPSYYFLYTDSVYVPAYDCTTWTGSLTICFYFITVKSLYGYVQR